MNILPKKRWHVRTKDNIARVRRDEAEAAEKEAERIHRAKLAEQESRTAYLRDKARSKGGRDYNDDRPKKPDVQPTKKPDVQPTSSKNIEANIYTSEGNINFFKDLEDGKQTIGTNKEHEAEKKAEQEKYEKSIGYLTYLGQDSLESKGEKPWYETHSVAKGGYSDTEEQFEEVGLKSKNKLDPINDIIKYAGLKPMKKAIIMKKAVIMNTTPKVEVSQEVKVVDLVSDDQGKEKRRAKKRSSSSKKRKHLDTRSKKRKKEHDRDRRKERHKRRKKKRKDSEKERERIVDDSECLKSRKDRKHEIDNGQKRKRRDSSDSEGQKRKRRNSSDSEGQKRKRRNSSDSEDSHSHERQKRRRHHSSSTDDTEDSDMSSGDGSDDEEERKEKQRKLEVLRAERLKREAEERRRAERLLAGQKPEAVEALVTKTAGYQQKYHSQYNPHIARQNQEPKTLETGVKYWLQ